MGSEDPDFTNFARVRQQSVSDAPPGPAVSKAMQNSGEKRRLAALKTGGEQEQ